MIISQVSYRTNGPLVLIGCWGPKKDKFSKKSLKIFSSETVCFMKLILCIHVPGTSLYKNVVFCSSQIRTLVAMATFSFHRLIMGKVKICYFCSLNGDI